MLVFSQRKRVESLQIGGGHVGVGSGQLLDRRHRLAQPCPHRRSRFRDRLQDCRFVGSSLLLAREHFSRGAVHRVDRNHVRRSQAGNRAGQIRLHSQPLAQLLRQFGGYFLLPRLPQVLQIAVQFRIADQLNEW